MNTDNKPYFFVPAVKPVKDESQEGSHTGVLEITIIVETPVHFGSGQIRLSKEGRFIHGLNRENKEIVLPGSSFKGMLRSFFEAVSKSCILSNKECGSNTEICLACSVFGRLGKKGRIGFSSFKTEKQPQIKTYKMPKLYSPKKPENDNYRKFYKHSDAYDRISKKSDSSLHYECLCQNTTLLGEITYQRLTPNQLGGLLFSLGLGWGNDKALYYKLGYGKPVYFGSVRLQVSSKTIGGSIIPYDEFSKEELENQAEEYYCEHKASISAAVNVFKKNWAVDSIGSICDWDLSKRPTY